MQPSLPESLLEAFGTFVEERIGLHLPAGRLTDLERGLKAASHEMGWTDVEAFTRHLLDAPPCKELQDMLAAHLTIGETYFYRDPRAFEVFENEVVPQLVKSHRVGPKVLRIWSAACCTGEEPYSIAMAIRRVLGDDSGWKIEILASDLNPRFLEKARKGIYGPWSFRTLPEEIRDRFFQKQADDRWRIDERIRKDVTFTTINFLEDTFPSAANGTRSLDVIFCRNVLMYFSRETAAKVIAKLRHCLVEDGWFFTSATDAPRDLFTGFTPQAAEGTIVYRRSVNEVAVKEAAPVGLASVPRETVARPSTLAQREASQVKRRAILSALPEASAPSSSPLHGTAASSDLRHQARGLADKGRLDEALATIDLAIESDKLDVLAHYLRGVILHEQNKEIEAAASLHRALYLDPSFVLAHVALGNLMRRNGKEKSARRCFDNARDLLSREDRDTVLPESGGMTAGRLLHMISTPKEAAA
jgi:chemotaxis protein methyltransferase CheR